MRVNKIWIVGGGRFGLKAAKKLCQQNSATDIIVIERDDSVCKQLKKQFVKTICMDGIAFLAENLKTADASEWIIPAIPMHVAYEWIKLKLSVNYHFEPLAVADRLAEMLPNVVRGSFGELYISNADFICPEDCLAPLETCTHTGQARPRILHQVLKAIQHNNFSSVVIKSQQMGPGIGGYSSMALFKALNEVVTSDGFILLSTACRCHGVMHAFKISGR